MSLGIQSFKILLRHMKKIKDELLNQVVGQKVYVQTQTTVDDNLPLSNDEIQKCINLTLRSSGSDIELPSHFAVNVRIVDHNEGLSLNKQYKNENLPTNVLSFEGNLEEEKNLGIEPPFLGDVVICLPVVAKEAIDQEKNIAEHFAHMLIHGFLHLLGFDHLNNKEEAIMKHIEDLTLNHFFILRNID